MWKLFNDSKVSVVLILKLSSDYVFKIKCLFFLSIFLKRCFIKILLN